MMGIAYVVGIPTNNTSGDRQQQQQSGELSQHPAPSTQHPGRTRKTFPAMCERPTRRRFPGRPTGDGTWQDARRNRTYHDARRQPMRLSGRPAWTRSQRQPWTTA